jgi:peptidoglycan/LPS O-acetylase OafA/YrhL
MYFSGIAIALATFFIIGLFHPIVIKTEYYFGTRPWWVFLLAGIVCIVGSLCIESTLISAIVGVIGASCLWSIGELFEQKKRVERGWFPKNPKRVK